MVIEHHLVDEVPHRPAEGELFLNLVWDRGSPSDGLADDPEAEAVERRHVGVGQFDGQPVADFLSGVVVVGEYQDVFGIHLLVRHQVGELARDHGGLTGAGSRGDQGDVLVGGDGLGLFLGQRPVPEIDCCGFCQLCLRVNELPVGLVATFVVRHHRLEFHDVSE